MSEKFRFETKAIHVGNIPDEETGAVSPPIHFTSTYQQSGVGKNHGFDYSRAANPTRQRYEENIASLESGNYGIAFASGMVATTALFQTLTHGSVPVEIKNEIGLTECLIRLSVGIEHVEDLYVDITQALKK